jgi:hypothetical protein
MGRLMHRSASRSISLATGEEAFYLFIFFVRARALVWLPLHKDMHVPLETRLQSGFSELIIRMEKLTRQTV